MKVFQREPLNLVRIKIDRKGDVSAYINIIDATREEVTQHVTTLLKTATVSALGGKYKTQVIIRESVGGKNGRGQTIFCYGLTPEDVAQLIEKSLSNEQ